MDSKPTLKETVCEITGAIASTFAAQVCGDSNIHLEKTTHGFPF